MTQAIVGVALGLAATGAVWAWLERRLRRLAEADLAAARKESEARWLAAEAWRAKFYEQARENSVLAARVQKLTTPPPFGPGPPS